MVARALPQGGSSTHEPCWRSDMPLVELAPNELRLSTDTNQDGGPGALERGNYCLGLWNREIQPRPASYTVQFHIYQIIIARMLSSAHITL